MTSGSSWAQTDSVPLEGNCPALYVLAVQGPDQAPPDAGPTTDSGALGAFFTSLASPDDEIQRAYVPYGHNADGAVLPYDQAVSTAAGQLGTWAHDVVTRCSRTRIAAIGYGDGAAAVSAFAHQVGAGTGPVPAEKVVAVALFANPARASGTPVFPGRPPGQTTPNSPPGLPASSTSGITFTDVSVTGSGIGQTASGPAAYGTLTGRLVDLCAPGDLSCGTPAGTPIEQTIHNIAAQSNLHDPISAITTVAQALAGTVWKTAVGVASQDIQGDSLDQLSYQPTQSLGQRLAVASNPNTPMPGPDQILGALFRLGTIGLSTAVSIAVKVFSPATIAELATVGLANPGAAIADLGVKLAGAVAELVPPQTALGWLNQAFTAVTSTVTNGSDLYGVATQAQYSDTTTSSGQAYTTTSASPQGTPAFTAVATWLTALAHTIVATEPASPPAPEPSSHDHTTTPATSSPTTTPDNAETAPTSTQPTATGPGSTPATAATSP
ncbi:cutinase family protein [Nocardia sp. GAS34]|uniref:cutinase family protein n=1 Tax=unclassified Nocardia TaxID=2637762 RepID=UPI003D22F4F7